MSPFHATRVRHSATRVRHGATQISRQIRFVQDRFFEKVLDSCKHMPFDTWYLVKVMKLVYGGVYARMDTSRTALVIPALNEEEALAKLLAELSTYSFA